MIGQHIGVLKDGIAVYDRPNSHLHTEYSDLMDRVVKTLADIAPEDREYIEHTKDFGQIVGASICVLTTDEDEIIYAKRPKRRGLTRFVKNREPQDTSYCTVVLKRDKQADELQYILITAYLGEHAPPEPWDTQADERAVAFWQIHAQYGVVCLP